MSSFRIRRDLGRGCTRGDPMQLWNFRWEFFLIIGKIFESTLRCTHSRWRHFRFDDVIFEKPQKIIVMEDMEAWVMVIDDYMWPSGCPHEKKNKKKIKKVKKRNFPNLIFSSTVKCPLSESVETLVGGAPGGTTGNFEIFDENFFWSLEWSLRVLQDAPIPDDVTSGLMTS